MNLMWHEWVNVAACVIVLGYAFFACYVMPSRGMWLQRLLLWLIVGMLTLQVVSPWTDTFPPVTWYGALLHASMSLALLAWHKIVMKFIIAEFLYGMNLDSDAMPLESPSAFDYVHNVYVVNRRRMLRRLRDREVQQPNRRAP